MEQNGKKKEIHEFLHYFYLKENKILDTEFLKWYMKYWYKMKLEDNYTLHIIDSDINLLTLKPEQYILIGDRNYTILPSKLKKIIL